MSVFQCPDCKQSVTLPNSLDPDAQLRCPLCGAVSEISDFRELGNTSQDTSKTSDASKQTRKEIRDTVVDEPDPVEENSDSDPESAGEDLSDRELSTSSSPTDRSSESDSSTKSRGSRSKKSRRREKSARGLEPMYSGRPPSLLKRVVQWGGGGIIGVCVTVLGLYLAGHFDQTPDPIVSEFTPVESTGTDPENELIQAPIPEPVVEQEQPEAPPEIPVAEPPIVPEAPEVVETVKSIEQCYADVRDALEGYQKSNLPSQHGVAGTDQRKKLAAIYIALSALGEKAVQRSCRRRESETRALLTKVANDASLWDTLRKATPKWLELPDRENDGVFLVAEIGSDISLQQRTGFSASKIRWEKTEDRPITVFAPTELLLPFQGKVVALIGAVEEFPGDIDGDGLFVNVASLQLLNSE